jgi:Coenzyme PQQ synthesis protein D (PqqD)
MPPNEVRVHDEITTARVLVPEHVVHREFPAETVVLNLNTGQYHGLNPTAGRMLDAMQEAGSVGEAVDRIASEFERPREEVEMDVRGLCAGLLERGLIELDVAA